MRGSPDRRASESGGRLLGTIVVVLAAAWVFAKCMELLTEVVR